MYIFIYLFYPRFTFHSDTVIIVVLVEADHTHSMDSGYLACGTSQSTNIYIQ
jgi:hypothetical protein